MTMNLSILQPFQISPNVRAEAVFLLQFNPFNSSKAKKMTPTNPTG